MTAFSRTTTDRTYYSSKHQLCAIETSYKAGLSFSYSTKGELHLRLNKLHINEKKNLCFFKTYLIFIYVYGGGGCNVQVSTYPQARRGMLDLLDLESQLV